MAVDLYGPKNAPRFLPGGAFEDWIDLTAVGEYAAKVGNTRVGTTAERNAATGLDLWEGLEWRDTTNGRTYIRRGSGWVLMASALGNGSVNGSAVVGVALPSRPPLATEAVITKSGFLHSYTFTEYGNGYMNAVTFDTPFPVACTGVNITQIQSASSVAASVYAVDVLNASSFRVFYPGSGIVERAFTWIAVGY
jgi:hypothetical protein